MQFIAVVVMLVAGLFACNIETDAGIKYQRKQAVAQCKGIAEARTWVEGSGWVCESILD